MSNDIERPGSRRSDDVVLLVLIEVTGPEATDSESIADFELTGFIEWKAKPDVQDCWQLGCSSSWHIGGYDTVRREQPVRVWQLEQAVSGSLLDDGNGSLIRIFPDATTQRHIVPDEFEMFAIEQIGARVEAGPVLLQNPQPGDLRFLMNTAPVSYGLISSIDNGVGFSEVEPWLDLEILVNDEPTGTAGQQIVVEIPEMASAGDVVLKIENAVLLGSRPPTVKIVGAPSVSWPAGSAVHTIRLGEGAYTVEVADDAGRTASVSFLMVPEGTSPPSVIIDASTEDVIVPGLAVELEAVPDPNAGNYEYDWRPVVRMALGDTIGGGKTLTVAPMVTTTYQVEVRDMATGFTATATHTVKVESRMVAVTVGVEGSGADYGEVELEGFEACLSSGCTHMVESGSVLGLVARGRENAVGEAEFTGWSCTEAGTQADTSLTVTQDVTCLATFNDVSSVCNAQAAVVLMVGGSPATSSNLNSAQVASAMVDGSGSEPDSMLTFEWSVAGPGGFSLSGTTPSLSLRTARPFGGYSASLTVRCTDDPSNSDSATLNFTVAP